MYTSEERAINSFCNIAYITEINFCSEPRTETLKIIQVNGSYEMINYAHVTPVTCPLHFIHSIILRIKATLSRNNFHQGDFEEAAMFSSSRKLVFTYYYYRVTVVLSRIFSLFEGIIP